MNQRLLAAGLFIVWVSLLWFFIWLIDRRVSIRKEREVKNGDR